MLRRLCGALRLVLLVLLNFQKQCTELYDSTSFACVRRFGDGSTEPYACLTKLRTLCETQRSRLRGSINFTKVLWLYGARLLTLRVFRRSYEGTTWINALCFRKILQRLRWALRLFCVFSQILTWLHWVLRFVFVNVTKITLRFVAGSVCFRKLL